MPGPSADFIERQRMLKACDLEVIAIGEGVKAADLADEATRDKLRKLLAERRGKRPAQVHVSIDTWRVLWRLMHDRETRGQSAGVDPFANLPGGGQ